LNKYFFGFKGKLYANRGRIQEKSFKLVFSNRQRIGIEMAGIFILFIFMMMKMNDQRFVCVVGSKMLFQMPGLVTIVVDMRNH